MDFYDTLKKICIEHGTSVSRLEKDLGFSNGSLAKGIPRADRLYKIADYFGLPMEYFVNPMAVKPLYRASAGDGAYNDENALDMIKVLDGDYEYAKVIGDSMLPELRDGDIVQIQPQTETEPCDFTLIKIDGENATIKFVEIAENGVWIRALNKEVFEDRFFSIQEVMTLPVTIIGKVVGMQRKFL